MSFLKGVANKYAPDRVYQMGDWTDSYCFSRYPKDIGHEDTYTEEYRKVRKFTEELTALFPKGTALKGNHDARVWERAKVAGIPKGLLIPYERVIGLEDSNWNMVWDTTFTVDADRSPWYLAHTKAGSAMSTAKVLGRNVAFGHEHVKLNIDTFQIPERRIYAVHTGCLIGDNRYAFAYNRQSMIRPNRGCVMIVRGIPRVIPMDTGPNGRWNKLVA